MIVKSRNVWSNQTVYDQVDIFQNDGYTRIAGLGVSNLTLQVFFNNLLQPWPLVNGAGVVDALVGAGQVYLAELPGASGLYGVRWRPNATGYWRLVLSYADVPQVVMLDYEVTPTLLPEDPGLKVAFVRPKVCKDA